MMTPKIVAYGKGIKPTGGRDNSAVERAKSNAQAKIREEPPLEGQRYEENGPQVAGTDTGDGGSGQRHKSMSMKRGAGPRNPCGAGSY